MAISPWAAVRNSAQPDAPPPDMGPWAPMTPELPPAMTLGSQPRVTEDPIAQNIENDQQRLQDVRHRIATPWGSPTNHPGKLGKVAHVFSEIGNIAGNVVAPNVMANIPGTQMGMKAEEAGLTNRLNKELEQGNEEEARSAQTEHTKAATDALQNPKPEEMQKPYTLPTDEGFMQWDGKQWTPITVNGSTVAPVEHQGAAKSMQHVAGTSQGKETFANYNPTTGIFSDQAGNPLPDFHPSSKAMQGVLGQYAPMRLAGQLLNMAYNVNPALLPQLGPIISHMLGGMPGANTAGLQETLSASPTGQPENAAGTPIGLRQPEAPTGATRSRGQFAESVIPSIGTAQTQIQQLKDKLGPMSGRYNELVTSEVGAYGPEFAGLQTNLHNIATAWMRLHANSDAAREDFLHQVKSAQSPENLIQVLNSINQQAKDYVLEGKGKPSRLPGNVNGAAASQPQRPANVPEGYLFNANGPNGAGWYKPKAGK